MEGHERRKFSKRLHVSTFFFSEGLVLGSLLPGASFTSLFLQIFIQKAVHVIITQTRPYLDYHTTTTVRSKGRLRPPPVYVLTHTSSVWGRTENGSRLACWGFIFSSRSGRMIPLVLPVKHSSTSSPVIH
ncbi:hypothetical protein E2C01_021090 [Portunus trituberculatus]|uniref:Uncharacterized protein n=1 Tax=Portunus trituberculatus TaxID=210409 RepID=A0A5B7E1R1_PORTR|nr:hypothetical protein [Portunus trituberculatus]